MQRTAGTKGVIALKDVFEEQRQRPPIQEQVVVGPYQLIDLSSHADQGETHQRGSGKCEALGPIHCQERLETLLLLARRQSPPVIVLPWDLYTPMDDLKRLRPVLPVEGSTQHRVTFHHMLPGLLQGPDLEMPMEETLPLLAIHSRRWRIQCVKEYALLHGRKGIDILNVVTTAHGSSRVPDSLRVIISSSSSCWLNRMVGKSEGV